MLIPLASALLTGKGVEMGLNCTYSLFKPAPGKQGADSDRGNSPLKNLLFSFPLHDPGEVQVARFPTQENIFSIISSVHLQTDTVFSGSTHSVAPGNGTAMGWQELKLSLLQIHPRSDGLPLRSVQFIELHLVQERGGSDQARVLHLPTAGNTTPYEPFLPLRAAPE